MSQMIMLLWWHLKYCRFVTFLAMSYCFSLRGGGRGRWGDDASIFVIIILLITIAF